MGISRGAIKLIGMTLSPYNRSGDVVTFGVQKTETEYDDAVALLSETGIEVAPLVREEIHRDYAAPGPIHQDVLFQLLGFRAIESIDFYPAEGPTHTLDLNFPVPDAMHGRFDLVYDGGTSEHCFAAPEVLSNAMRLLKPGGRVIHHLPMNNWVDHGFYQFSPTLFFDFYEANGFDQLSLAIHFMMRKKERYIAYDPRQDGNLPYSLGGRAKVLLFFSARKAAENKKVIFPIQGRYRRTFGAEQTANAPTGPGSRLARLKKSIRKRTVKWRARAL